MTRRNHASELASGWRSAALLLVLGGGASCAPSAPLDEAPATGAVHSPLATRGPAFRVRDLRSGPGLLWSLFPEGAAELVSVGSRLFFAGPGGGAGHELWTSDGTSAGTRMVRDLHPGLFDSLPQELTGLGEFVYFRAQAPGHGEQVWRSDGTAEGTIRLTGILPELGGAEPRSLTPLDGTLHFLARSGGEGMALWRTDGTLEGTRRVGNEQPVIGPMAAVPLITLGHALFFPGWTPELGTELWRRDLRTGEATLVAELAAGSTGSNPRALGSVGDSIVFEARSDLGGAELWITDGIGAAPLKQVGSIHERASLGEARVVGELLFFEVWAPATVRGLWRTDGTEAGTFKLASPDGRTRRPAAHLTSIGDTVYFAMPRADGHSHELWRSDGSLAGTWAVAAPVVNGAPAAIVALVAGEEGLRFTARGPGWTVELWTSDGTPPGTIRVAPLPFLSLAGMGRGGGSTYLLGGDEEETGLQLLRADAHVQVPVLVRRLQVGASSDPNELTDVDGTLYFKARTPTEYSALVRSDAAEAGTVVLEDGPWAGLRGSPTWLTSTDGMLFFVRDGRLFSTDGTPEGSRALGHLGHETSTVSALGMVALESRVLIYSNSHADGGSLQRSDRTGLETAPLRRFAGDFRSPMLTKMGAVAFFVASDQKTGRALWKSDGTAEGTMMVKDLTAVGASSVSGLTALTRALYFVVQAGETRELWTSDGTTEGTVRLDGLPMPQGTRITEASLTGVGDRLYFLTTSPGGNGSAMSSALWTSDGTSGGTRPLLELPNGQFEAWIGRLTAAGRWLYFAAMRPGEGTRLWRSDGTVEGTRPVEGGSLPTWGLTMGAVGDTLYFGGYGEDALGVELWSVRGRGRAARLQELRPGPESSNPSNFVLSGEHLFFTAEDEGGRELWALPVTLDDERLTLTCPESLQVESTEAQGAVVTYPEPTAGDAVTPLSVIEASPPSGSWFPPGATEVRITASDDAGNEASCSFTVTVVIRSIGPEPEPEPEPLAAPVTTVCGCGSAGTLSLLPLVALALLLNDKRRRA